MKTRDTLSLVFNDQSCLENYHASLLYQMMENNEKIKIFKNLDGDSQKYLRKLIIKAILATDMAFHFKLEKDFA